MVFFCWEEDAEEELDREDAECRKDRDHPLSVCERNDTEDGVEWREEHNSELDEDLSEPDEEEEVVVVDVLKEVPLIVGKVGIVVPVILGIKQSNNHKKSSSFSFPCRLQEYTSLLLP